MPATATFTCLQTTADYRRHARRLRKVYADQPARLHHYLQDLSRQHDSQRANDTPAIRRRMAVDRFSSEVSRHFAAGVLRYSQRVALIDSAARYGLSRFHANLVVAMVQNRAAQADRPLPRAARLPNRFRIVWPVLTVVVIQSAILYAGWRILHI